MSKTGCKRGILRTTGEGGKEREETRRRSERVYGDRVKAAML